MADGAEAGQAPHDVGAGEDFAHMAHVPLGMELGPVIGRDAAGLLPPMLEHVQAERHHARRLRVAPDAEDAAFQPKRIVPVRSREAVGLDAF